MLSAFSSVPLVLLWEVGAKSVYIRLEKSVYNKVINQSLWRREPGKGFKTRPAKPHRDLCPPHCLGSLGLLLKSLACRPAFVSPGRGFCGAWRAETPFQICS